MSIDHDTTTSPTDHDTQGDRLTAPDVPASTSRRRSADLADRTRSMLGPIWADRRAGVAAATAIGAG